MSTSRPHADPPRAAGEDGTIPAWTGGLGDDRLKEGIYYAVHSMTTNPPIRAGEQIVSHNFIDHIAPALEGNWPNRRG